MIVTITLEQRKQLFGDKAASSTFSIAGLPAAGSTISTSECGSIADDDSSETATEGGLSECGSTMESGSTLVSTYLVG